MRMDELPVDVEPALDVVPKVEEVLEVKEEEVVRRWAGGRLGAALGLSPEVGGGSGVVSLRERRRWTTRAEAVGETVGEAVKAVRSREGPGPLTP